MYGIPSGAPVFCQRLRIYATLFESRGNAEPGAKWGTSANRRRNKTLKDLAAMIERDVAAQIVAQIYLARPGDFLLVVQQHFFPLRDPSRSARNRKQHGEHGHRESHRLVDEAGIEVHVGIEATRDEVFVLERDAFAFERDINQRVAAHHVENF